MESEVGVFIILSVLFSVSAHAERYFALLDSNDVVQQVIVAEPQEIARRQGTWVETFMDGSNMPASKRKNPAGPGAKYDRQKDAFINQKPFPSWKLNDSTLDWEPPTPRPNDGKAYKWNENKKDWEEIK